MRWLVVFLFLSVALFGSVTYMVVVVGPDEHQTTWRLKKKWSSQTWPNIDYVVIGNSKTMALNADYAIPNLLNLALSSIHLEYIYYTLKEFSANNPHIKQYYIEMGLVPSGYEHFIQYYASDEMVEKIADFEPQIKTEYEKLNWISKRFYPLQQFKYKYKYLKAGITNAYIREFLEKTNGAYIFGPGHKKFEDRNDTFNSFPYPKHYGAPSPIDQYCLEKIIQFINEKDLNVKFFFSPNRKTEMEYWTNSEVRMEAFRNIAFSLRALLEHNQIPQLYLPDEYFVEGVHLRYQYAPIFTEYFRTCIMNDDCAAYENDIIWLQDFLEQPEMESSHAL